MSEKYKILSNRKKHYVGRTLYQIIALRDIVSESGVIIVPKGTLGGHIEDPANLSQEGSCWVYPDSVVYHFATVKDNASIMGKSVISEHACISGDAIVKDAAIVEGSASVKDSTIISGFAFISGTATICNNAKISGNAKVFGNALVSGGAEVRGQAKIKGNAKILNCASVIDSAVILNATVKNYAIVSGSSIVRDNASIEDNARVCKNSVVNGHAVVKGSAYVDGACISGNAIVEGSVALNGHSEIKCNSHLCGNLNVCEGSVINIVEPNVLFGASPFTSRLYDCSFNNEAPINVTDKNYKDYMIVPIKKFGCITFSGDGGSVDLFLLKHTRKCLNLPSKMSFKNKSELLSYIFDLFPKESKPDVSEEVMDLEEIFCDFLSSCYEVIDETTKELSCSFLNKVLTCSSWFKKAEDLIKQNSDEIYEKAINYFFAVFVEIIMSFLFEENNPCSINVALLNEILERSSVDIHSCAIKKLPTSLFSDELIIMVAKTCNFSDDWKVIMIEKMKETDFLKLEPFLKKGSHITLS